MLLLEDKEQLENQKHIGVIGSHRIPRQSRDSSNKPLPKTFQPGKWDVLCCGGKEGSQHIGNKRYRKCIKNTATAYHSAKSKYHKSVLVSNIVASIKEASNGLGGFVKKDPLTGRWCQVADKIAREKVSHALRDAIKVEKRREASQKFIIERLHTRSLTASRRFGMHNDTHPRTQRAAHQGLILPPSPCWRASTHSDGCNRESLRACGEEQGDQDECVCMVNDIFDASFGKNCNDDWEKSLEESTKHFLQSDEGHLCWTFP